MNRKLHIDPVFLQTDKFLQGRKIHKIDLGVDCSLPEIGSVAERVQIRKIYQNKNYYNAGLSQSRRGWFLDIPTHATDFKIRQFWKISFMGAENPHVVIHDIDVSLSGMGEGLYTMWPMLWKDREGSVVATQLRSVGMESDITPERKVKNGTRCKTILDIRTDPIGIYISERVRLNKIGASNISESELLMMYK